MEFANSPGSQTDISGSAFSFSVLFFFKTTLLKLYGRQIIPEHVL